jgi:spore germination protein GerM
VVLLLALLLTAGCGSDTPEGEAGTPEGEAAGTAAEETTTEGEDPDVDEDAEPAADPETAVEEDAPSAPLTRLPVTLYFPSLHQDALIPEPSEIFNTASAGDRAKQIVSDLIEGPKDDDMATRCLPTSTRLRQIYVLDDGTAWADFNSDLRFGLGGGTDRELMAVYAIVDSIVLNIPEIDRVGLLIEGEPIRTLNGHLDLSRPLGPNIMLVEEPRGPGPDARRIVEAVEQATEPTRAGIAP